MWKYRFKQENVGDRAIAVVFGDDHIEEGKINREYFHIVRDGDYIATFDKEHFTLLERVWVEEPGGEPEI